jgi:hypothetical protein
LRVLFVQQVPTGVTVKTDMWFSERKPGLRILRARCSAWTSGR